MNYRSVSDLNTDARRLAEVVPKDVDLVVGIPRSGLLAATMLCLHLDRPMTDLDGLFERRLLSSGRRSDDGAFDWDGVERVLVVDDSVNTGWEMTRTRERIDAADSPFDVEYAAVYVTPGGFDEVDHYVTSIPTPRIFEWHVLHHPVLWNVCVNLEGVLCPRPHGDVRDESAYRSFLEGAGPLVVPSKEVGWVVSHRPEEYRDATEAWLERHGVEYETLVMADPGTEPSVVEHGVDVYDSTGALLFVEGSHSRAGEIASRTGRPVYAYESGEMVRAPTAARTQREVMDRTRRYLSKVANDPVAFLSEATEYVSTRGRYHAHLMLKSIRE